MAQQMGAVKKLLKMGASTDVVAMQQEGVDRNLPSTLVVAASMNQTDICIILLDAGANASACDSEGYTAMHHAADAGNRRVVKALLDNGADPHAANVNKDTPLSLAQKHGAWFQGVVAEMGGGKRSLQPLVYNESDKVYWDAVRANPTAQAQVENVLKTSMLTNSEKREILMSPYARPEYIEAELRKEEGNAALGRQEYERAIELYSEAVSMCPNVKEFHANRAVAYLKARRLDEALKDTQRARQIDPTWAKAFYREGQVYRAMGNLGEAGVSFWEALRLDPGSADARAQFSKA
eukprot:CAMPEP_0206280732 /NCGR_PEP_ID=MMETSP0047_2-20121206/38739_1 /ASSEMBLY_ACC=CAM_ASM_000192 /TAXON_ID=195065 /ORGANISM="Chroomonas mesostigmatica_cf, Strain CCMP1168" /LENGTH=293 /DNA_ID=CAMNT_0053710821 /DNA_START=1 /DNA_END=878 /DNA_ORIENTATION=+